MNVPTLLIIFATILVNCQGKANYDDFKVYKVTPLTEVQVSLLRDLEENFSYSFWTEVVSPNKPVHIMVPPKLIENFNGFLRNNSYKYEIFINNVQERINQERSKVKSNRFDFQNYHSLEVIYDYLEELADAFPENVKILQGGESYEKRKILGVHISYSKENENRSVFIEGGIHAREWISPSTVMYITEQVLKSDDPKVRHVAESHDWYIFPVFNPDGYEYTHTNDRLWRKTRTPGERCSGADPNRNWGYHWMNGGASSYECSETYAGRKAFSEPETASMAEFITSIHGKIHAYISFHSFSQLFLISYGDSPEHVENYDELYEVGVKAADKLKRRHGTEYTVGNIVEVIYVASGSSMDWVKGTFGIRWAYTLELRDTGKHGFILPPEQIIPTGEETFDALLVILEEAAKRSNFI